jgi:glucose-1-phosphatase
MIKTILFDWGGVCCSGANQYTAPILLSHLKISDAEIIQRVLDIETNFVEGKISKDEFWDGIIKRLNVQEITNKEELRIHYLNSYKLYPDVLNLAKNLKEKYKVALLSNLNEEMEAHIQKNHNTQHYFNPLIFSHKEGFSKPEKKIYELALEKLNCKPDEIVFIDDSKTNIEAAKKVGIIGILFTNYDKLVRDLEKLKVL